MDVLGQLWAELNETKTQGGRGKESGACLPWAFWQRQGEPGAYSAGCHALRAVGTSETEQGDGWELVIQRSEVGQAGSGDLFLIDLIFEIFIHVYIHVYWSFPAPLLSMSTHPRLPNPLPHLSITH